MKILHYINNLAGGGAERLLSFLLPLLKKNGHEVHLAYCNDRENIRAFEELLEISHVVVHNFNVSPYSPLNAIELIKLNKKEQFDVIHAHLFPTQYWLGIVASQLSKSAKLIKTEHNTYNRRRSYPILKVVEKGIYNKYDKIIAITEEVKINLDKWLGSNSTEIVVIENGVSLSAVRTAIGDRKTTNYQFLKAENINLLMVASFSGDAKDQISLIKSLQFLPDNVQLFFAGQGELLHKAKEVARSLGIEHKVTFLGMRTDVYSLMNLVDINILSSNYEGMSGVALESMASSKPFIGSNVPGIREIVPNNDFLFEKGNPQAIAKKIKDIYENSLLSERLVQEGNNHVEKYDIRNMSEAYEKLYLK